MTVDTDITKVSILGKETIIVGKNLIPTLVEDIQANFTASKYVLVTDENIAPLHLKTVTEAFENKGLNIIVNVITPGEQSKCRETKADIEDWMLSQGCSRDTVVIAFGGGVVGDLTGYVAATYMRGVRFIQLPTSLLAMVDSSVGGKTGIDTPSGKNLVGAFHQPVRIYIDVLFLKTLPQRQLSNGMAEVIKTAAIWNEEEFTFLENNVDQVFEHNLDTLKRIVLGSVKVKAEVCTKDEKESGLRGLLNFGHTIGHAVEAICQPEMLHGEAVAIGMLKEVELSRAKQYCKQECVGRLTRCIQLYKLQPKLPSHLKIADIMKKMEVDKKNINGKKNIVLLKSVGVVAATKPIQCEDEEIEVILSEYLIVKPKNGITGEVQVPGSKSISNRALLLTGLGGGTCKLSGLLHSDDTKVMLDALAKMGVAYRSEENGEILVIEGSNGQLKGPSSEIYLGNAGTASRFLTSAVNLIEEKCDVIVTGNARMKQRPIGPLVEALCANGASINFMETDGCLPLNIHCDGGLKGGKIDLSANISSQYVSSLLISAPFAKESVTLSLVGGEVVSQPYIDMTLQLMERYGCTATRQPNSDVYTIPQQSYQNPEAILIEGDASSATYPLAIAAISGGEITVSNVGFASLQGDAEFCKLLEKMGCTIQQTKETTTVKGPGPGGLKAISIDMMTMTDAFMTAAVLCAVASGTSQLTGIANQRVKECDRLAAMVKELGKLGVTSRELPDGIEIEGRPYTELNGDIIHCYDDHRIAMSFGVLGCLVPGIIISEKNCVEKTYPEFWDILKNTFGVSISIPAAEKRSWEQANDSATDPKNGLLMSPVIIGMRGAGKSSLGKALSKNLNLKLLDIDEYLETKFGCTIMEFVNKNGWESFRDEEQDNFAAILGNSTYQHGHVIICGGGIIEREKTRTLLKSYPYVFEINRDIEDIVSYLEADQVRPTWAEHPRDIYKRRRPLYSECRAYVFPLLKGEVNWLSVENELCEMVKKIITQQDYVKTIGDYSNFVCTTFPDLSEQLACLTDICVGASSIELRVDLLDNLEEYFILQQVALIRRYCKIPIIFTVRSKEQGGNFTGTEEQMKELLALGCSLGCEFIDVEIELSEKTRIAIFKQKKNSSMICSYHVPRSAAVTDWVLLKNQFSLCCDNGRADVVKVVAKAKDLSDVHKLQQILGSLEFTVPTIAIAMGPKGALSRVLNTFMTPITHPAFPVAAAPGQLTAKEINLIRTKIGMIEFKEFCIFGKPVAYSMSPTMHNTAFDALGLPYKYTLRETDDIEVFKKEMLSVDSKIWGCSVTIPLKEKVKEVANELSPAAQAIGAVNTIIKREGNYLLGDNTDWIGIVRSLENGETQRKCGFNVNDKGGLVIGAGGTARAAIYALKKMGFQKVFIYNRTKVKAEKLAEEFSITVCEDLNNLSEVKLDAVVSTVPATSGVTLPKCITKQGLPVVLDAAYKPRVTKLLQSALDDGCVGVEGINMLIYQGLEQLKLWTNLKVTPEKEIRAAVEKNYKE